MKAEIKIEAKLDKDNRIQASGTFYGKEKDLSYILFRLLEQQPNFIPVFKAAVEVATVKYEHDPEKLKNKPELVELLAKFNIHKN